MVVEGKAIFASVDQQDSITRANSCYTLNSNGDSYEKKCILKVWIISQCCSTSLAISCWSFFPKAQELEAAGHTKKAVAEYLTVVQGSADALTTLGLHARTMNEVQSDRGFFGGEVCEQSR